MDDLEHTREAAAGILAHPVPVVLPADGDRLVVAASLAGDPPRPRLAWVDTGSGEILARVACPPGRPSRPRPVVAAAVTLDEPTACDQVLVARAASEVAAVRVVFADHEDETPVVPVGPEGAVWVVSGSHEDESPIVPVGPEGLALVRLPVGAPIVRVEALDARGEPVGLLVGEGVTLLRVSGGAVSGRLGLGHGMAAGIGAGTWVSDLEEAAFAAGYVPWLPSWVPPGLTPSRPRIEPDTAYPAAPPSVVLLWTGDDHTRLLVRQAPAPLASPELGGPNAREVDVAGVRGILRGRQLVTLVWETEERAFGLQVRWPSDPEAVALRIARSIAPPR
jgi:hypothetical protein